MTPITVLHLTDLHFGWDGDDLNKQAERRVCLEGLLSAIAGLDSYWKPSVVCISGDIGWRGKPSDYAEAGKWFGYLLSCCNLRYDKLVICAGNHDANRPEVKKYPRPAGSKEADEVLGVPIPDHFVKPFAAFNEFCQSVGVRAMRFGDGESHLVGELTVEDIRFVSLNSAWFSKDDEDKERLWLGLPHVKYLEAQNQLPIVRWDGSSPFTIALMHHPPHWLHPEERCVSGLRPNTVDYLAQRCHLLLTGHTHGEVRRPDRIAEGAYHLTGGAAYAGDSHFNSFRLLRIERGHQIAYRPFEFDPRSAENKWKASEAGALPLVTTTAARRALDREREFVAAEPLRSALRADAQRLLEQKSRLLRPSGPLPKNLPQQVSVRVSAQVERFDPRRRLVQEKSGEHLMPLYDATRKARRTLLLGDLGTGKSTLAASLVLETIERSATAIAVVISLKSLRLRGRFNIEDILQSIAEYLANQAAPTVPRVEVRSLLETSVELLLVFDGLDELAGEVAARLLKQVATLTELWPTVQIVATGRPVELLGVSYADWCIAQTVPLSDESKRDFLKEELIADGVSPQLIDDEADALLRSLKTLPALDALATSPLTIRLLYRRLHVLSMSPMELTLGDLLYDLLLERLGVWQGRDDKPRRFDAFEAVFPTPEGKAGCLSLLTSPFNNGSRLTVDEAKTRLQESASDQKQVDRFRLADEALAYFALSGLIIPGESLEFPIQPLFEVAAAIRIAEKWSYLEQGWQLPGAEWWRAVSFVAAVARRRGWLVKLREPILRYIDSILLEPAYLPAVCYIVGESGDRGCAERTLQFFGRLGRRPLTVFGDERSASSRNVAKTLWLAEETGFEWFYGQYLDPRYPLPLMGVGAVEDTFREWAFLVMGCLTGSQKDQLARLVRPYLTTGGGHFYGVLSVLSVLTPDAFETGDRLWFQSELLDSPLFGKRVTDLFVGAVTPDLKELANKVLLQRSASSTRAAMIWLELNLDTTPPPEIINAALRACTKAGDSVSSKLVNLCRGRLGEDRWLRFAWWSLSGEDRGVAAGAAITLRTSGERRITMLGDALLQAIHDGGYIADAEKILGAMVSEGGGDGVRWLVSRMADRRDLFGFHSGAWRILLKEVESLGDGPDLLGACLRHMGPFTLPRYPEIREAFSRLLTGPRAQEFHEALVTGLHSLDPYVRRGAAVLLVTVDPRNEAEALFVAVRGRAMWRASDWHEWETFCLTLNFGPSVLAFLSNRLGQLDARSRAFALALLVRNGFRIEGHYHEELRAALLLVGNWYLDIDALGKMALASEESFEKLLGHLNRPGTDLAESAADHLLKLHRARLSLAQEAKCLAITTKPSRLVWDLARRMLRVHEDTSFAAALALACKEICDLGAQRPFLQLVVDAQRDGTAWKDIIWAMLCDDTGLSGSEPDDMGAALLEYGLAAASDRQWIAKAAIECLNDPRMRNSRWVDAYHWLVVIADEFGTVEPTTMREALIRAGSIWATAATALIARLGEVPVGAVFQRGARNPLRALGSDSYRETVPGDLIKRLKDYSRDSDQLHPGIFSAIEEVLYSTLPSEAQLSELAATGKPGILIAMALRHCYSTQPKLAETIPLMDRWSRVWESGHQQSKEDRRLRGIWMAVRFSVLRYDKEESANYLTALDKALVQDDTWRIPVAAELFRIRGSLLPEQVIGVFRAYADHVAAPWDPLFGPIVSWLSGEVDGKAKEAVLIGTREALVILNEEGWGLPDGSHMSPYPFMLFPVIEWALTGQASRDSEAVFLRGIKVACEQRTRPDLAAAQSEATIMGTLEPLLRRVPREIFREALRLGIDSLDPTVRAFSQLICSLALGPKVEGAGSPE